MVRSTYFHYCQHTKFLIGITLHEKIEGGLDMGIIAIIPVPGVGDAGSKWQCVLVDHSYGNSTCYKITPDEEVKWRVRLVIYSNSLSCSVFNMISRSCTRKSSLFASSDAPPSVSSISGLS